MTTKTLEPQVFSMHLTNCHMDDDMRVKAHPLYSNRDTDSPRYKSSYVACMQAVHLFSDACGQTAKLYIYTTNIIHIKW